MNPCDLKFKAKEGDRVN